MFPEQLRFPFLVSVPQVSRSNHSLSREFA